DVCRHAARALVAPSNRTYRPIAHVPSFAFAHANASGEDEARCEERTGPQEAGPVCGMSWETLLSRPSHRHCRHRCERPLRMDAPSTGWVTVLAGLLARRSSPYWSGLPRFPVAVLELWLRPHQ